MSVELVIIIPMLLLVVALVYAYARVALVNANFEAGVRDAARAASQSRSAGEAEETARRVVEQGVARQSPQCLESLRIESIPDLTPGYVVTVQAECDYALSDLLVFVPGEVTVASQFSSPVDPNRGVTP
ncbi:hypothetical protein LWF01_02335 [Saxibacter everestensis]|uniref:TadE-like domain-containing protein n=1 Tax=Saxibacter everestensis TaxID=2909229 RepID=A0ABY8QUK4_9MICO|nr:hypothetical protein LWF01_02335 [Brevibacteriaceae bacterium ZFBP1038]